MENGFRFGSNSGSFVADWSDDDIEDAFELRAMLEAQAARRAATRIAPAQLEALRHHNRLIGAAIAGDDVLRDLVDDGILTVDGTFTISSYDSTAIEVVLVPAPGVVGLLASVLVGRRRPTRRRA